MKTQNTPTIEITESTRVPKTPEMKAEGNTPSFWQPVLVGGVPGLLIGAGGAVAAEEVFAKTKDDGPDNTDINDPGNPPFTHSHAILEAHSVNDDMSFSEAFAAARAEVGPGGAFVWHGNVYGTYRGDDPEWQAMSDEERAEHSQAILSQVHPVPYTPTANEPAIVAVNDNHPGADDSNAEVDVHIVGIDQGYVEDGTLVTIGYGAVDGHYAEFVDTDGDGEVDTVLIDANDNHVLDEGEAHGASGSGITIDDMVAEAQANAAAAVDDALYGDMPDYTNDADTSSFN